MFIILLEAVLVLFFHKSHGYFIPTGSVGIGYNGYFTLTNTTKHTHGRFRQQPSYIHKLIHKHHNIFLNQLLLRDRR